MNYFQLYILEMKILVQQPASMRIGSRNSFFWPPIPAKWFHIIVQLITHHCMSSLPNNQISWYLPEVIPVPRLYHLFSQSSVSWESWLPHHLDPEVSVVKGEQCDVSVQQLLSCVKWFLEVGSHHRGEECAEQGVTETWADDNMFHYLSLLEKSSHHTPDNEDEVVAEASWEQLLVRSISQYIRPE